MNHDRLDHSVLMWTIAVFAAAILFVSLLFFTAR
jgi:hypothetical protein